MNKDYYELNDTLENEKASILAEQNAREEIENLIALAKAKVGVDTFEDFEDLLDLAELTAEQNPLSETAEDVKLELSEYIR